MKHVHHTREIGKLSVHVVACSGGGSLRGVADANGDAGAAPNGAADRELMAGVDIVYLKNVLLKFLDAATAGRFDQVRPP